MLISHINKVKILHNVRMGYCICKLIGYHALKKMAYLLVSPNMKREMANLWLIKI